MTRKLRPGHTLEHHIRNGCVQSLNLPRNHCAYIAEVASGSTSAILHATISASATLRAVMWHKYQPVAYWRNRFSDTCYCHVVRARIIIWDTPFSKSSGYPIFNPNTTVCFSILLVLREKSREKVFPDFFPLTLKDQQLWLPSLLWSPFWLRTLTWRNATRNNWQCYTLCPGLFVFLVQP